MCSTTFALTLLLIVVILIILKYNQKSQENFKHLYLQSKPSHYPFEFEKLFAGHNHQLDWVRKGIRPGNSSSRTRL